MIRTTFNLTLLLLSLATLFAFGGCATTNPYEANATAWAASVKPVDPVPASCERDVDVKDIPKLAAKDYDAEATAREYAKLRKWAKVEIVDAKKCRIWSRGQR